VANNGKLVNLLRKGGALPSASPSPAPQQAWSINSVNDVSGSMVPVSQATIDDATARLFPELGLGDSISSGWNNDLNNATGWLMGSGDRTPEFLSSGWSGISQPSGWDPVDALSALDAPQPQSPTVSNASLPSRRVTLDVGSFIDEVIKSGICLGRAPGFRKKDVEKSLISSIIEIV